MCKVSPIGIAQSHRPRLPSMLLLPPSCKRQSIQRSNKKQQQQQKKKKRRMISKWKWWANYCSVHMPSFSHPQKRSCRKGSREIKTHTHTQMPCTQFSNRFREPIQNVRIFQSSPRREDVIFLICDMATAIQNRRTSIYTSGCLEISLGREIREK